MSTRLRAESAAHPSPTAIKPCPFCGADPVHEQTDIGDCFIGCQCEATPGIIRGDADEAIAAWNRRASEAELVSVLVDATDPRGVGLAGDTHYFRDTEFSRRTLKRIRAILAKHGS